MASIKHNVLCAALLALLLLSKVSAQRDTGSDNSNGDTSTSQLHIQLSTSPCAQTTTRKEWRALNSTEQQRYVNAVVKLLNTPGLTAQMNNAWDSFVLQHYNVRAYAHNNSRFLVWHRGYLKLWENVLQTIDPSIVQPYWDWTLDSENAPGSQVFLDMGGAPDSAGEGGNGRPGCLDSTNFASVRHTFPVAGSCIARVHPVSFYSSMEVNNLIKIKDFSTFTIQLEFMHGNIHTQLGGRGQNPVGFMSTHYSPHDHIFMMHHAQVDRIFALWQKQNPTSQYGGNPTEILTSHEVTDSTWTPDSVWNTTAPGLCYTYAPSVRPSNFTIGAPGSGSSSDSGSGSGSGSSSASSLRNLLSEHAPAYYAAPFAPGHSLERRQYERFDHPHAYHHAPNRFGRPHPHEAHHTPHDRDAHLRAAFLAHLHRTQNQNRNGVTHSNLLDLPSSIDPSKTPNSYNGRDDPYHLHLVPPLPDWYIDQLGYSRPLVRAAERIWSAIVQFVNSISGYTHVSCYAVARDSGFRYVQMSEEEERALMNQGMGILEGLERVIQGFLSDLEKNGGDWGKTFGDEVDKAGDWIRSHTGGRQGMRHGGMRHHHPMRPAAYLDDAYGDDIEIGE